MVIPDEQVASFRAFLSGDSEEGVRRTGRFVESRGVEGYGELVYAAFALAVRRRFAPSWTIADVVRSVAAARARLLDVDVDIDPRAAEVMIRRVLGDAVTGDFEDESKARAQVFVLLVLVDDEEFDDAGLDAFLADVRALADQLTGRRAAAHSPRSSAFGRADARDGPCRLGMESSFVSAEDQDEEADSG